MECIALIGPMGSGKSTVGRALAERLGWAFVDTDELLAARAGCSIATLFAEKGEAYFRDLEEQVLAEVLAQPQLVVATGGGVVLRPANRRQLRMHAHVIWLQAEPATLAARVLADPGPARPLLAGKDPAGPLAALLQERAVLYTDSAHVRIATEGKSIGQVAEEVEARYREVQPAALVARNPEYWGRVPEALEVSVRLGERSYVIRIGEGILQTLGEALGRVQPGVRRALVISDDQVGPLYLERALQSLQIAGIEAVGVQVPAGEGSKCLQIAGELYTACVKAGLDRTSAILALGGGVVGDLAGFVAATYMRGIPFVQVPTTLLAQVDASVGGKVAVDLPEGKNLVGAFHQPELVAMDLGLLRSLSRRELASGFGEVIKHAVIRSPRLLDFLHAERHLLLAADPSCLQRMVAENCRIKAAVVEADETEQGERALLNFGHTLGHAYETIAGYHGPLHGEAISVGMVAATRLSQELGILQDASLLPRLTGLLQALGLPVCFPANLDPEQLLQAAARDKKAKQGRVRWVLPVRVGEMQITADVPADLVRRITRELQFKQ